MKPPVVCLSEQLFAMNEPETILHEPAVPLDTSNSVRVLFESELITFDLITNRTGERINGRPEKFVPFANDDEVFVVCIDFVY